MIYLPAVCTSLSLDRANVLATIVEALKPEDENVVPRIQVQFQVSKLRFQIIYEYKYSFVI